MYKNIEYINKIQKAYGRLTHIDVEPCAKGFLYNGWSIIGYNPRGLTEDPGRLVIHRLVEIINPYEGIISLLLKVMQIFLEHILESINLIEEYMKKNS